MFQRLLIVDGSSILNESYYGTLPEQMKREKDRSKWSAWYGEMLHNKEGVITNALFTTMKRLEKIITEQHFEYVAIAWDVSSDTFRKNLYPEYKGNREKPDASFISQKNIFPKMLSDMGYPVICMNGYEADDCIGSLVKRFEKEIPIVILSGDKDMTQLVSPYTQVWFSCKKANQAEEMFDDMMQGEQTISLSSYHLPDKIFPVSTTTVPFFMGVNADQVVDLKAISGDTSDNYPGIAGIGEKGAIALLKYFGSIDKIIEMIKSGILNDKAKLKSLKEDFSSKTGCRLPASKLLDPNFEENARFYQKIARIETSLPLITDLSSLHLYVNEENRKKWYNYLEFYSLLKTL